MMATVKDKKKMLGQMHKDLQAYPPKVVVPAHGPHAVHATVGKETLDLVGAAI
ncbi:MAG: hypothetical protein ACI9WU_002936 [Myxococcota bacterium]|jgi:hypothetical protein